MSAVARAEISAAVSTVAGVDCSPYFRSATSPGAAYVRRDRTSYPNKFGGEVTWQVFVVLPQDEATAEQRADELLPLVVAALGGVLTVSAAIPQDVVFPGGTTLPCLVIEGHRESE